jgi:hypothetical protein
VVIAPGDARCSAKPAGRGAEATMQQGPAAHRWIVGGRCCREVQLSHLTGIDFFVSYWSERLVGHTFLSFIFDNASPLSISIETRSEGARAFSQSPPSSSNSS